MIINSFQRMLNVDTQIRLQYYFKLCGRNDHFSFWLKAYIDQAYESCLSQLYAQLIWNIFEIVYSDFMATLLVLPFHHNCANDANFCNSPDTK